MVSEAVWTCQPCATIRAWRQDINPECRSGMAVRVPIEASDGEPACTDFLVEQSYR